jgi:hypothetical protein
MKNFLTIITLIFLLLLPVVSAEDVSVDQQKQMMIKSADEIKSYTYSRLAENTIVYSNDTLQDKFEADKATEGKVNLTAQSGWWSHQLTDSVNGEVLTWQGYFINGTEYWKEGENWTQFNLTDLQAVMEDYNELPGQVELLNYSILMVAGSEEMDGEDCYKIETEPIALIQKAILANQIFASYLASPFHLPDEFKSGKFNFENTSILNNSNISITAWVSKETSLLRRIEINSNLTLTPAILKIAAQNFTIQSTLHETTDYAKFDQPVQITLPDEEIVLSYRMKGADWRWAAFGMLQP